MDSSNQQPKQRLPAIVSDIDGVVYSGGPCCGDSPHVVSSLLLEGYGKNKKKIPFVFLTNGGMVTEDEKAESLNKKMNLQEYQKNLGVNNP